MHHAFLVRLWPSLRGRTKTKLGMTLALLYNLLSMQVLLVFVLRWHGTYACQYNAI